MLTVTSLSDGRHTINDLLNKERGPWTLKLPPIAKMLANFATKTFIPLPDDIQKVNVSQLLNSIKEAGASLSYPSLLKLIRGAVEVVNGFERSSR